MKKKVQERKASKLTLVIRFLDEHSFMLDTLLVLLVIMTIGYCLGMRSLEIMPETYLTQGTQGLGLANDEAKVAILSLHIAGTMAIFILSLLAININMWLLELSQALCKKIKRLKTVAIVCLYFFLSLLTTAYTMMVSHYSVISQIYSIINIVVSIGYIIVKAVTKNKK